MHSVLDTIARRFSEELGLDIVAAVEVEFYLHGSAENTGFKDFQDELAHALLLENLNTEPLQKERGPEQYELALNPRSGATIAAEDGRRLRTLVERIAQKHAMRADFSAKPFSDQPGSGMHLHVHLTDKQGRNHYFKQGEHYSDLLNFSIGGLQASMKEAMPIFAPSKKSYARFVPGYNVPVTVSWGANNRTVAIRLPTKPADNKHIEHRVAGADADPALAMAAVLAGIHYGIQNKIAAGEQIFGDAALPMYALEPLPRDLRTAVQLMKSGKILSAYFGSEWCAEYCRDILEK